MKDEKWTTIFISISFILVIIVLSIFNFSNISKHIVNIFEPHISFSDFCISITDAFKSDDLFHKDDFINLNGLYGRLSKRQKLNNVVRLNNGMLATNALKLGLSEEKTEKLLTSLTDFQSFVNKRGAHFFYVQLPAKYDMSGELMPEGYKTTIPQDTENLLATFKKAGVDVIDTLPFLSKDITDIERNYYRTDHHWNPIGAFKAFILIMDYLQKTFPDEPYGNIVTDWENWSIHTIQNQFLGSLGKRVGVYFSGLDTLTWLTPNFETNLSVYVPKYRRFLEGNYQTCFIVDKYMEKGGNKLHDNHYCIYLGGDFPLIQSRNTSAFSKQKVFLIKDSYSLPLITYLSLIFREVDIIDPRYYTVSSLSEYVDRTRPDIVLMAVNSSVINNDKFFVFKSENDKYLSDKSELIFNKDFSIDPKDHAFNNISLYDDLQNDTFYTISIDQINVKTGSTNVISLSLFDKQNNKRIEETAFNINYCNNYKNCEWTFRTPNESSQELEVLAYSGMIEHSNNIGIDLIGTKLTKRESLSDNIIVIK